MDGALIEETIRTLFTDLKEDKVESHWFSVLTGESMCGCFLTARLSNWIC